MKSVKKSMIKVKFGENEKGPHISLKVRADASEVTQAIVELISAAGLNAKMSGVQLGMAVFIFGMALGQPPSGYISDYIGRRPIVIMGIVIFLVATIFIARSTNLTEFLTLRFIEGIGCAFVASCSFAMISEHYQTDQRIRAMATLGQITNLAPMLGPMLGTLVLQMHDDSWQAIYYYNCVLVAIILFLTVANVPETLKSKIEKQKEKLFNKNKIIAETINNQAALDDIEKASSQKVKETVLDIIKCKLIRF